MMAHKAICQYRGFIEARRLLLHAHAAPYGQGPVIKQTKHSVFQQCASFAEYRDNVYGLRCPVPCHESCQLRITMGHLDRKRQVADVFKKPEKHGNVIVFEVPLLYNQIQDIKSTNQ